MSRSIKQIEGEIKRNKSDFAKLKESTPDYESKVHFFKSELRKLKVELSEVKL